MFASTIPYLRRHLHIQQTDQVSLHLSHLIRVYLRVPYQAVNSSPAPALKLFPYPTGIEKVILHKTEDACSQRQLIRNELFGKKVYYTHIRYKMPSLGSVGIGSQREGSIRIPSCYIFKTASTNVELAIFIQIFKYRTFTLWSAS